MTIRSRGCESADLDVNVTDSSGADISGALHRDTPLLLRGPAGDPNWGRIGIAMWHVQAQRPLYGVNSYDIYQQRMDVLPGGTGVVLQPSLTFRWWTLGLEIGYAVSNSTVTYRTNLPADGTDDVETRWFRAGARVGARFPFHSVAVTLGVGIGHDTIANVSPTIKRLDSTHDQHPILSFYDSLWANVDIHMFCDWLLFGGVHLDSLGEKPLINDFDKAAVGFTIGAAFQPNHSCEVERSTDYGLTAESKGAR